MFYFHLLFYFFLQIAKYKTYFVNKKIRKKMKKKAVQQVYNSVNNIKAILNELVTVWNAACNTNS